MRTVVEVSRFAEKQLNKVPRYILEAFQRWVVRLERWGLHETRKIPGFHDEPLKGNREGQRSIRLSRSYRVIYRESDSGQLEVISIFVLEVNKHDY